MLACPFSDPALRRYERNESGKCHDFASDRRIILPLLASYIVKEEKEIKQGLGLSEVQ